MRKSGKKVVQRKKPEAVLLAFFLGWLGIHRFYLGQTGLGILYVILCFTGISFLLGFIDFILLLVRDKEDFNRRYNADFVPVEGRSVGERAPQRGKVKGVEKYPNAYRLKNLKEKGKEEFKRYDIEDAITTFAEALTIDDKDISLYFNLACSYSLLEEKEEAFDYLSHAVRLGFDDYEKIMNHDALAFLRIQEEWEDFRSAGFALRERTLSDGSRPNLLDELHRLDRMREAGYLSPDEFRTQKKELLREKKEE